MMTENDLRKVCPRCGEAQDLAATVCALCGRKFRTRFAPGDVTLSMPAALHLPAARAPAETLSAEGRLALRRERPPVGREPPRPAAPAMQLRLGRPKPLAVPQTLPPEVRHRAALDECASRFLGLARFYVLACLTAPTVLMPLLVLTPARAAEARLRDEVAALGVDAEAWAAPLRRARAARILRGVGTALALALLLVVSVLALHKGINSLDAKMDPLPPDAGIPASPDTN